jgi:hypothetical protein
MKRCFYLTMLVKRVEPPQGGSQSLCSPPAEEPRLIPGRDATCPGRSTRYPDPVRWYPSRPSFEPYERGPCPAQHLRLHSTCLPFLHRPSFLPLRAPRSPAVRIRLILFFAPFVCCVLNLTISCLSPPSLSWNLEVSPVVCSVGGNRDIIWPACGLSVLAFVLTSTAASKLLYFVSQRDTVRCPVCSFFVIRFRFLLCIRNGWGSTCLL